MIEIRKEELAFVGPAEAALVEHGLKKLREAVSPSSSCSGTRTTTRPACAAASPIQSGRHLRRNAMSDEIVDLIIQLETEMAREMVNSDAEAIGRFLADDWVIVIGEGGVIERSHFLNAIESGSLTHELMELSDWRVRVYGESAVATSKVESKGLYNGEPFGTYELSTSVYVKQEGRWRCVLTQLTALHE
jgi:ketosteroid isomerase-like protein